MIHYGKQNREIQREDKNTFQLQTNKANFCLNYLTKRKDA
jgi:hypothetical protein